MFNAIHFIIVANNPGIWLLRYYNMTVIMFIVCNYFAHFCCVIFRSVSWWLLDALSI